MKKILVFLVCLMTMSTMSIKAQDGNLTEGQWKHGLAVGAQWIAIDLGFGKPESEVIKKLGENYSLDDLRALYGSKSSWVTYYDKLNAHVAETGTTDKLVSTIMEAYNKPYMKGKVKSDIDKYNASHDGNEVQSAAAGGTTTATTAATTTSTTGTTGTNVVAASDSTKAAATTTEKEEHGGHGFLYFLSILGLVLGALGTFLAMQARKENQVLMRDANDDIKNLQKQIDKLRATIKNQEDAHRTTTTRRENRPEQKNSNDNLAQAKKIDFNSKPADKAATKPAEKKTDTKREEAKREEVKKVETNREEPKNDDSKREVTQKAEPKREEQRPAATALGEPRILYMAKPDEDDNFSRSASAYEPGNSIFELTTMDGKNGSFTVLGKSDAQKLALLMPGDSLARACSGNNIQSTAGKTRIVTDRAGRAQLQNGKWHIVVKAIVHYV